MKKIILPLTGLAIVIIAVVIFLNPPEIIIEKNTITISEKPINVPNAAIWVGGIDGGNFVLLEKHETDNSLFHSKIFNDNTGNIEYDGILKYNGNQNIVDPINTQSLIQGWDGDRLHLTNGEYLSIYR